MEFVLFLLVILRALQPLYGVLNRDDPTTSTTCGPVMGETSQGVHIFRGIPYAKPPVGDLRWRPPQELSKTDNSCWNGTYKAQVFGDMCVQRKLTNSSILLGKEDCLFLNVWTPTLDKFAKLPVMVYIHGGFLTALSGNSDTYCPNEKVVKSTGMVFVSMNYRLQALGFMALQMLADESPNKTSGNYGFMDQILALQWVQDNILNFGGDPNKVTVFGQSSGGTSVFALLASPLCQGLFHRAWLISASPVLNKTASEAFADNMIFVANTPCQDLQCLRKMTAEEVTLAVPWDKYPYWGMNDLVDLPTAGHFDGALAIVDGYVLEEAPFDAWAKGRMIDVPTLVSTTAQEVDLEAGSSFSISWAQYEDLVKQKLSTFGSDQIVKAALSFYPSGHISPEFQYTSLTSNIRVGCGNDYLSLVASESFKSPVYRYVATYYPSQPVYPWHLPYPAKYAFHGVDIFAFFETLDQYITPLSSADRLWQQNLQKEVIAFAKNGRPSTASWSEYPAGTGLLSTNTAVVTSYKRAECLFWQTNGFLSYGWIN